MISKAMFYRGVSDNEPWDLLDLLKYLSAGASFVATFHVEDFGAPDKALHDVPKDAQIIKELPDGIHMVRVLSGARGGASG